MRIGGTGWEGCEGGRIGMKPPWIDFSVEKWHQSPTFFANFYGKRSSANVRCRVL
jgi:hypothetical protein